MIGKGEWRPETYLGIKQTRLSRHLFAANAIRLHALARNLDTSYAR